MAEQELESTLRDLKAYNDAQEETTGTELNFDSFIKDREEKRCEAVKKAEQERKATEQEKAKMCALREEMKAMRKEQQHLKKKLQKKAIYKTYLEEVAQASNRFQDSGEVISYFENLMLNQEEVMQITGQDSIEHTRAQQIQQSNETIVHYKNTLSQLQSQLDMIHTKRMIWESNWANIQNTAAEKALLLGSIKMATSNVYQRLYKLCKHTEDDAPVAPDDVLRHLEQIPLYFSKWKSILEDLAKLEK
ncbi:coiled-coil domain-containing protein 42-like [Diretmus argenteus]